MLESNKLLSRVDQNVKLFLSKICERLHYASYSVIKDSTIDKATVLQLISTYKEIKLNKLMNY